MIFYIRYHRVHCLTSYNSYVDQLNQILQVLGTPSDETMDRIGSPKVHILICSLNAWSEGKEINVLSQGERLYSRIP